MSTPAERFDDVRVELRIVEELELIRTMRGREAEVGADAQLADAAASIDGSRRDDVAPLLRVLLAARVGMMRHPAAAAAVFRALVREGERVVATPEGAARAAALARDPLMDDLRRVWEATSLNVLQDATGVADGIPAGWLDLLLDAVASGYTDRIVDGLSGAP